jgi:ribonuclease-3
MAPDAGSQMVASSASNKALGQLAHRYGLEKYVTKNPCQRGDVSDYTLATTVEALVGAVWIDCDKNLETIKGVIDHLNMVKN